MCGNVQTYFKFIQMIDALAKRLRSLGWVVLCKKHPLETETPPLHYAQYVPENTNFIDLLELADRVALINSGVGVYAMMMEKPCFIFGDAFYAHPDLNHSVAYCELENQNEIDALAKSIIEGFEVKQTIMHRFIHYLINDFYSFGQPSTVSRKEADGSLRTVTTSISFYDLKIDGEKLLQYSPIQRPSIPLTAPLFERYGLDLHNKRQENNITPAKLATATMNPASSAAKNTSIESILQTVQNTSKSRAQIYHIKWAKFKRNPYQFFDDSKKPYIRLLRHLFTKS